MVMRPDVLDAAIAQAKSRRPEATLIYFTPRGTPLSQKMAHELSQEGTHPALRAL